MTRFSFSNIPEHSSVKDQLILLKLLGRNETLKLIRSSSLESWVKKINRDATDKTQQLKGKKYVKSPNYYFLSLLPIHTHTPPEFLVWRNTHSINNGRSIPQAPCLMFPFLLDFTVEHLTYGILFSNIFFCSAASQPCQVKLSQIFLF